MIPSGPPVTGQIVKFHSFLWLSTTPVCVGVWGHITSFCSDFIYFKILFIERGEGREKERERNITVWLPLECPLLGTWPATRLVP